MIKTYFKLAWRNILREKGYAFVNIAGLAIGMAAATLIILWVQHELTFDRFYSKTDRIYELYNRGDFNNKTWAWNNVSNPLAPLLEKKYPEFERITRYSENSLLISVGEQRIKGEGAYADKDFFKIFDFAFIHGNNQRVLTEKNGIVVTESLAKKLFNSVDILGETVQIDSSDLFTVTGLIKDPPTNSRFKEIEYVIPWTYFEENKLGKELASSWINFKVPTFVLLKSQSSQEHAEGKIKNVLIDLNVSKNTLFLHSASKWHLYSDHEDGHFTSGRIVMVRFFSAIALFILVIACINFVNLSTARSEKRAREVGIRKVVGAQKKMLISQFLVESLLLTSIAGVFAFIFIGLSLGSFNTLIGATIDLNFMDVRLWSGGLIFILLTSVFAGSYPAFFLSSFQPIRVLRGVFIPSNIRFSPRKILIVFQFTFTIALIISTFIIYDQVNYAQKRNNGYDKHNLISLPLTTNLRNHYDNIRHDLMNAQVALSLTRTSGMITNHTFGSTNFSWPESTPDDLNKAFVALTADASFKQTMGIHLLQGRDIDIRQYKTDSSAILLNEAAVKAMNIKNPIGTIIRNGEQKWHVVGVINDFIFYSPYTKINPLFILGSANWFNFMYIKFDNKKSTAENLQVTENVLKKYDPLEPFNYNFTDEAYAKNFEDEQRKSTLIGLFSCLTILVSCLGLLGLIAHVAEQRKKEVSVRKILGAPIQTIALLLTKEFFILVFIAFLIASPIAYLVMEKWLQNFEYRISVPWQAFILSGFVALLITILTIGFQALKAAFGNPVNSLRSE